MSDRKTRSRKIAFGVVLAVTTALLGAGCGLPGEEAAEARDRSPGVDAAKLEVGGVGAFSCCAQYPNGDLRLLATVHVSDATEANQLCQTRVAIPANAVVVVVPGDNACPSPGIVIVM